MVLKMPGWTSVSFVSSELTQVAALALGVIGLSLAYDWLSGLGG